jgi:carboxymethylenebutenolidase
MGSTIELHAADGHTLSGYSAGPEAAPHALVVIQEIFGVNHHMREVCDEFAAQGYRVIAPALFDRVQRGIELGYGPDDRKVGMELRSQVPEPGTLADVEAAAYALGGAKLGIVGYCWGGTLAYLASTRLEDVAAAVGYYGGGIAAAAAEMTKAPTILHFGEKDHGIPLTDVDKVREHHPDMAIYVYPADHGFNCEQRGSYEPESSKLALQRTLEFLHAKVG